jgi:hypothetical protein
MPVRRGIPASYPSNTLARHVPAQFGDDFIRHFCFDRAMKILPKSDSELTNDKLRILAMGICDTIRCRVPPNFFGHIAFRWR